MTSKLEQKFIQLWDVSYPDIPLTSEVRFHPIRRWRFDFANMNTKIAIEINGGTWVKSGHSSGQGIARDYEKLNEANLLGWTVFQLAGSQLTEEWLDKIAGHIRDKT